MMPFGYTVLFGSFKSVPPETPPSFLPMVKPACICHFCEKRLVAVNSIPL